MYARSISDPNGFWAEQAQRIDWIKPFTKVKNTTFQYPDVSIKWFEDGVLNISANCIDRHLATRGDEVAIIWEGDTPGTDEKITYNQLYEHVCRFANVLKAQGVKKGDRVTIYMPMIPAASYAMLACARIGAVHSVVFGGFSPEAVAGRIRDCDSRIVITADEGRRGGKTIALKANVDKALESGVEVDAVIVVKSTGADIPMVAGRDIWLHEAEKTVAATCAPEPMNAEDPLFVLYTSGSTGKPKGVLHTTGGYIVWASLTHELNFDYRPGDIYWCTADIGWVTGHTYIVYGPLANGATTIMFEGIPNYPNVGRFWDVVDKYKVNIFHTAPTAIRALMGAGTEYLDKADLSSLRVLGTVGEPINPEAWRWYYNKVGRGRCGIVDTWWQTETGGVMITALPGAIATKPGSATLPFFGVQPVVLSPEGVLQTETVAEGVLAIKDSWPGQARTIWGDHKRFVATYFEAYKGYYFSGDGCRRDEDGYYWITGRVDDVINVSGHRLGTAEVESALVSHAKVSEAAVVGYPHDLKGQGIYCYVTLMTGEVADEALKADLKAWVRKQIGPIATPDLIQFAPGLPKTRSGKIMRRILRKVAENEFGSLGDTSTLADPAVVNDLIENRQNR
ncbi:MAG TPA: acetate--CoA ligase [Devosia sp.]|nr:acetate--CoA ligase [Devosia sp.]